MECPQPGAGGDQSSGRTFWEPVTLHCGQGRRSPVSLGCSPAQHESQARKNIQKHEKYLCWCGRNPGVLLRLLGLSSAPPTAETVARTRGLLAAGGGAGGGARGGVRVQIVQ